MQTLESFKTIVAVALVAGTGLWGQAADASTVTTCSISGVNFYLHTATAASCVAGNDLGAGGIQPTDVFFGASGWVLGDSTGGTGDGTVVFPTGGAPDDTLPTAFNSSDFTDHTNWGDWETDVVTTVSGVMLVLKQTNNFAAFHISNVDETGYWLITKDVIDKTTGNKTGENLSDISHSSVYYTPAVIPIPAAGLLLLTALGGLGVRRTAQTQGSLTHI